MPPEPIEFKHLLARNLRKAAAAAELRQERLRKRMNNLGFGWVGSTVSLVMRGRRRVTAEELIGLALALETTPGQLLAVEDDDGYQNIVMPSGFAFPGRRLFIPGGSVIWKDDEPVLAASPTEGEADIGRLAMGGLEKMIERAVEKLAAERLRQQGGE